MIINTLTLKKKRLILFQCQTSADSIKFEVIHTKQVSTNLIFSIVEIFQREKLHETHF